MKYFKSPETSELFAYEADGSQDAFIPPDLVPITVEEADAIRSVAQTVEPPIEELRARTTVSAFQARAALHLAGHLSAAEAFVASSGDPVIQMAWEYAVEFKRLSPTILAAQAALGLTDEQMDELFALAATIEA